jgi:hypothetical protein
LATQCRSYDWPKMHLWPTSYFWCKTDFRPVVRPTSGSQMVAKWFCADWEAMLLPLFVAIVAPCKLWPSPNSVLFLFLVLFFQSSLQPVFVTSFLSQAQVHHPFHLPSALFWSNFLSSVFFVFFFILATRCSAWLLIVATKPGHLYKLYSYSLPTKTFRNILRSQVFWNLSV